MLPGVVNKGHIQIIESVVILGNVHWKMNWMQLLHREAIDPILE